MSARRHALVLHATSGALGHHSLAHAYAPLVAELAYNVRVEDVLGHDRGPDIRVTLDGHFAGLHHAPWLWRGLYGHWSSAPGFDWGRRRLVPLRFPRTLRLLREADPALIVTTHALATLLAAYAKSRGWIRGTIVAALYNWHFQPFWMAPLVDGYLCVTEAQARMVVRSGVAAERVATVGMPVDEFFYRTHAKTREPAEKPLVFVTSGGTGWRAEEFLRTMRQLRTPVSIVIGGVPEPRRSMLEEEARRNSGPNPIQVVGRCDLRPYFAAADVFVGKPAMSVAEALALGLPAIIGFPVPGHDERAVPELLAHTPAAALPPDRPAEFVDRVLAELPQWRAEERCAARKDALGCRSRVVEALQRFTRGL